MMGWFHVAEDKSLPAEPAEYVAPLKALLVFVEQGSEFAMQMADSKFQKGLGAKLTTIPAPPPAEPAPAPVAASATKEKSLRKLGWSEQAAALGARVMAIRELSDADLFSYLKQIQVDPSNDSEVRAILSICLHTRDAFRVASAARKADATIASWAEFIESAIGTRLLDKECDSEKVQKCIDEALAVAEADRPKEA